MNGHYFFGIDFGTTMSSIAVARHGEMSMPECIEFRNSRRIETAIRLSRDGTRVEEIGNTAWMEMADNPTTTFYNFKPLVGTDAVITQGSLSVEADRLAEMYLSHLRPYLERYLNMNDLAADAATSTSVIGHPAEWASHRVDRLRRIATAAGFPNVTTCPEPLAAVHRHLGDMESDDNHAFLVYDFGGGTTDIAVCRFRNGHSDILYLGGDAQLGGSDYDRALARHFFQQLGVDSPWPIDLAEMYNQSKKLKENLSDKIKDRTGTAVKIGCSLANGRHMLQLDRDEFERTAAELIARFDEPVRHYQGNGNVPVNVVVATGGSSHLYFVDERLKSLVPGCRLYRARYPQESIAIGLALSKRIKQKGKKPEKKKSGAAPDLKARDIRKRLRRELAELIDGMTINRDDFFKQSSGDRAKWLNERLKEFHLVILKWGQLNGLIAPDSYAGEVKAESELGEYLLSVGLMTAGGGGAAAALLTGLATVSTTVAAPGVVGSTLAYLGLTGTFGLGAATVVTTTWPLWVTAAVAAAPVAIAGFGIFALFSWSKNKQYAKVMEKVEEAKKKVRDFFESQIDQAEYSDLMFSERGRMTKWD